MIKKQIRTMVYRVIEYLNLPLPAITEQLHDLFIGLGSDPGIELSVNKAIEWICRAQDKSTSGDGGIAHHYSLVTGWGPSYPETTGYIIPTIIDYAEDRQDELLMHRARKMLNWLVKIQLKNGGFQGGTVFSRPVVAVSFNTGQILLGLSKGTAKFGEPYLASMHRAAEWLINTQDDDGCWRKYPSPFAIAGEKTYYTHIAYGLIEASRVSGEKKYSEAAIKNVYWALTKQQKNGWFASCCLTEPAQPLTHTIGYALRGVLETYLFTKDPLLLDAGRRAGEGLLHAIKGNGFLSGRLDSSWKGVVPWACLTGSVQIAHCLLILYKETKEVRFHDAAFDLNRYVRRTICLEGPPEKCGAIKGSFPIYGDYGRYRYLNWPVKFFIDSNIYEQTIRKVSEQKK